MCSCAKTPASGCAHSASAPRVCVCARPNESSKNEINIAASSHVERNRPPPKKGVSLLKRHSASLCCVFRKTKQMPLQRRHGATVLISIFFCLSCQTGNIPSFASDGELLSSAAGVRGSLFRLLRESREDAVSSLANGWPFERGSRDKFYIFAQLLVTLFHIRVNALHFGEGLLPPIGLWRLAKPPLWLEIYAAILLQYASTLIFLVAIKCPVKIASTGHVFTYWWAWKWPRIN